MDAGATPRRRCLSSTLTLTRVGSTGPGRPASGVERAEPEDPDALTLRAGQLVADLVEPAKSGGAGRERCGGGELVVGAGEEHD